jgi:2-phosphoglycerate kinase
MARVILLGGAPAIGKSLAAQRVASLLGIPCISTDAIRQDMRKSLPRDQFPGLFLLDERTIGDPVDYLSRTPVDKIVSDVDQESRDVWQGVVVRMQNSENDSCVIEGVAVIPEKAFQFMNTHQHVKAAILVNSDAKRIRDIISERGLGGPPDLFPEWIQRKQFDWVELSNARYKSAAEHCGLPIIDLADERYVERIQDAVS